MWWGTDDGWCQPVGGDLVEAHVMNNVEDALSLFVLRKTVEAHLRWGLPQLGVRPRTALA